MFNLNFRLQYCIRARCNDGSGTGGRGRTQAGGQPGGQYPITCLFIDYVRIITRRASTAEDNHQNDSGIKGPYIRNTAGFSGFMYYVNDGVFGSFSVKVYEGLLDIVPVPAQVYNDHIYLSGGVSRFVF